MSDSNRDQEVMKTLNELGGQIGENNRLLLENVQAMIYKAQQQNQRRRRKCIGEILIATPGNYLSMQRGYDDGFSEFVYLTKKLTGSYAVYSLDFHGREKKEKFGIYFVNEKIWVIGNKKNMKPDYLWQQFTKTIGGFNPGISRTIVGRILYDFFAVQIEQTENRKEIPVLAGWHDGNFLHCENFMFTPITDFPDLPILRKKFTFVKLTREIIALYLKEMGKISDGKNRLLIALYPFAGILSSIFNSLDLPLGICINFVEMENVNRKRICSWFKIFDRDNLFPNSLDIKDADLEKMIMDTNDEVLICDATWYELDTKYRQDKIKKNVLRVIDMMRKQGNYKSDKKIETSFSCVFFSKEKLLEKGVFNIWADGKFYQYEDLYSLAFLEKKAMEGVLSDFVNYVKRNMEIVWGKMIEIRKEEDENQNLLAALYDVYNSFWKEKGISIKHELDLPEKIVWNEILNDYAYTSDEILNEFVRAIRKNMMKLYAIRKERMAQYRSDAIYFSDEFIWISTNIFNVILQKERILNYRNEILILLKSAEAICTDRSGFSRKILVSKNQFEAYQIRLSIFNKPGAVRLLDLAKEVKEC